MYKYRLNHSTSSSMYISIFIAPPFGYITEKKKPFMKYKLSSSNTLTLEIELDALFEGVKQRFYSASSL